MTATSTPSSYSPPVIAVINNPTITDYELSINANGDVWSVASFSITFSDDMVATTSGDSTFGHSVLNPANYQFTPAVCTPASYSSKEVSFSCGNLSAGTFGFSVYQSSSNNGVWASATSLGLSVNNTRTVTVPTTTGSTGGSSLNLF